MIGRECSEILPESYRKFCPMVSPERDKPGENRKAPAPASAETEAKKLILSKYAREDSNL